MANEETDKRKLQQCLIIIINAVSETINDFKDKTKRNNEKEIVNDLKAKLENLLNENISFLSSQHQNYLFKILCLHHYNQQEKTFSSSFKKEMLYKFLYDLQGSLYLIDACEAAWNGSPPLIKDFIKNYSLLKDKTGPYGTTLLYSAARNNHFDLIKYLIEDVKCSVNARNEALIEKDNESMLKAKVGSTALHAACFHGHIQIVKYLIEHGGDYFIRNNAYETPIENGQRKPQIRNFFIDFLISSYSGETTSLPNKTILDEIEHNKKPIVDCIWEYKPFSSDRWFPFSPDASTKLQQTLINNSNENFIDEVDFIKSRDEHHVSMLEFLRFGKHKNRIEDCAWIRCRGSSLLNFHFYSQWQIMFIKHPIGKTNSSLSKQIFDMKTRKIHLNVWYNSNVQINFSLEKAINYRRRYLKIKTDFFNNELIRFDLENFTFNNQQNTIEGFLRWTPKFIRNDKKLTPIHNLQRIAAIDLRPLTLSYLKEVHSNGTMLADEFNQYMLKYEDVVDDNILDTDNKVRICIHTYLININISDLRPPPTLIFIFGSEHRI